MKRRIGRPCLKKNIDFSHESRFFKPQGVPMRKLDIVELNCEELEVLRLKNIENFDQRECAEKMNTSPATVQRILSNVYRKISEALIDGKAIEIINEELC